MKNKGPCQASWSTLFFFWNHLARICYLTFIILCLLRWTLAKTETAWCRLLVACGMGQPTMQMTSFCWLQPGQLQSWCCSAVKDMLLYTILNGQLILCQKSLNPSISTSVESWQGWESLIIWHCGWTAAMGYQCWASWTWSASVWHHEPLVHWTRMLFSKEPVLLTRLLESENHSHFRFLSILWEQFKYLPVMAMAPCCMTFLPLPVSHSSRAGTPAWSLSGMYHK